MTLDIVINFIKSGYDSKCCSVLQCVAVFAVCYSVLQCVTVIKLLHIVIWGGYG